MEWTETPPSEPGWYWVGHTDGHVEIVCIDKERGKLEPWYAGDDRAYFEVDAQHFPYESMPNRWYGPLTPPPA